MSPHWQISDLPRSSLFCRCWGTSGHQTRPIRASQFTSTRPRSAFERIDPYVEAAEFSFEDVRLRRLDKLRKIVALDVRRERGLILVALIEQPLLRIVVILGDIELPTPGLSLETAVRVLLGERTKIPGTAQRHFEFGNDCDHRPLPSAYDLFLSDMSRVQYLWALVKS